MLTYQKSAPKPIAENWYRKPARNYSMPYSLLETAWYQKNSVANCMSNASETDTGLRRFLVSVLWAYNCQWQIYSISKQIVFGTNVGPEIFCYLLIVYGDWVGPRYTLDLLISDASRGLRLAIEIKTLCALLLHSAHAPFCHNAVRRYFFMHSYEIFSSSCTVMSFPPYWLASRIFPLLSMLLFMHYIYG